MTESDFPEDISSVEKALVAAAESMNKEPNLDTEALRKRANRHIGVSDAVNFGFAYLLGTLLVMLTNLSRSVSS